jgi:curved DNA-binding protein CbpA
MANTLYDVLEVIPTASAETIHAAYRSLILRYHPDKVAALGPELQVVANARTKEINFAYDILSDEASRARYDEELRGGGEEAAPLLPPGPASSSEDPGFEDTGSVAPGLEHAALLEPSAYPEPAIREPAFYETDARPQGPAAKGPAVRRPAVKGRGKGRERPAAARSAGAPGQDRHPLATLAAAIVGIALILALPPAANVIFGAVEFSLTGHAPFFYEAENPVDAKGNFGSTYLPVLWGWLFANYLFGLVSYRLAVFAGETAAEQLGGSFAATNDRLFLFLTFVCVVAVAELFFSAHTMGSMLAGMFTLAGAYLAERGIT